MLLSTAPAGGAARSIYDVASGIRVGVGLIHFFSNKNESVASSLAGLGLTFNFKL